MKMSLGKPRGQAIMFVLVAVAGLALLRHPTIRYFLKSSPTAFNSGSTNKVEQNAVSAETSSLETLGVAPIPAGIAHKPSLSTPPVLSPNQPSKVEGGPINEPLREAGEEHEDRDHRDGLEGEEEKRKQDQPDE
ncbi:MAG TPA: hypothetical protein VJS64_06045, partial [Pyrinomonadaceae bacterium]|nr:hypothetical protein [Pyrinomonadaceae bacterium]